MIALDLGLHRKARIWLAELPNVSYQVDEVFEHRYIAPKKRETVATRAAIEILIPRGGRAQYGLLGGEFEPHTSDQLIVQLCIGGHKSETVDWALAATIDTVRTGLPREYANAVLEGSENAPATLGAGVLQLNCAAHGEVGSSGVIFKRLAHMLIQLFVLESQSQLEEILAPIATM